MQVVAKWLLCAMLLAWQAAPGAVPVGKEPRHHVVFQNRYVRVIDARIAPGDTTLFHTHTADNVPVAIRGGPMHTEVFNGKTTESEVRTGGVWWAKGGYTHRIRNEGKTPLRFIDAEVLDSPVPGAGASPGSVPGPAPEIENARVRVYRVRIAPGASSPAHRHARPALRVIVTPGRVATRVNGGKRAVINVAAGVYRWTPGPETHTIANVGKSPFEMIEIEWK